MKRTDVSVFLFFMSFLVVNVETVMSQTVAPQPVLYYNFEEGGGTTITNLGASATNGILTGIDGDERFVAGAPSGFSPGGAIEFDGQNRVAGDMINSQLSAIDLGVHLSEYTMAAWIQVRSAKAQQFVFSQTNATGQVLHNGVRNLRLYQGHWGNDLQGSTLLDTGVWYHAVWAYDGAQHRLFLDGVLNNGPVARGALANSNIVTIGNAGPSAWGFQGVIDEVAIYGEQLSGDQIVHLANGGDPLNLPTSVLGDGEFFTAPMGPGGTWNLYELVGVTNGTAATFIDAETIASNKVDPSGLTSLPGHLSDVISYEENYLLSRMVGFRQIWIGLTDEEFFGGSEAGNNRNGNWVWTSGVPYGYQNWNGPEPNDAGAGIGEDAVLLNANSGLWNDHLSGIGVQTNNALARPFVIEWNIQTNAPIPGVRIAPPVVGSNLPGPAGGDGTFGVRAVQANGNLATLVNGVISLESGNGVISNGVASIIDFVDPESPTSNSLFGENLPYLGNTTNNNDNIVHIYKGRIVIPVTSNYTFGARVDDACALRIVGETWTSVSGNNVFIDSFDPSTICVPRAGANFRGLINLAAGEYDVEFIAVENGGASGHELFAVAGDVPAEAGSTLWRLIGHQSVGLVNVPGIRTVDGTNFLVRTTAPGSNAAITNLSSLADAQVELDNDTNAVLSSWEIIDFVDPQNAGGRGTYSNDNPFDNGTGGNDEDFAMEITATLDIPADDTYVFGFRGDDGSSLQIVGQVFSNIVFQPNANTQINGDTLSHDANTGDSNSAASIALTTGTYDLRVVYYERGGGAHFEVFGDTKQNAIPNLLRANGADSFVDPDGLQLVSQAANTIVITDPLYSGGMFSLNWSSESSATYTVEWSTDYITWNTVQTGIGSGGSETTVNVLDTFNAPFVVFRVNEE